MTDQQTKLTDLAKVARTDLLAIEKRIRLLFEHDMFRNEQAFPNQQSEMKANIMLSIRHIEDARMRLGKLCQYAENGISIYDTKQHCKNETPQPISPITKE